MTNLAIAIMAIHSLVLTTPIIIGDATIRSGNIVFDGGGVRTTEDNSFDVTSMGNVIIVLDANHNSVAPFFALYDRYESDATMIFKWIRGYGLIVDDKITAKNLIIKDAEGCTQYTSTGQQPCI